jgi:hypothetical protein
MTRILDVGVDKLFLQIKLDFMTKRLLVHLLEVSPITLQK